MKDKDRILILTGLNFDYFQRACNDINSNSSIEKFARNPINNRFFIEQK